MDQPTVSLLAPPNRPPAPARREAVADVDPLFVGRWSPRAFLPDPVPAHDLAAILEAARWAPSSNNEQPWRFLVAATPHDRERFAAALIEGNRAWAANAPVLLFLLATKSGRNGAPNPSAPFDAGAAWMSVALQAHLKGYATHAMGGIHRDLVHDTLGVPRDEYDVLIAIALGRAGDPGTLPPRLREREHPNGRKPLDEITAPGGFPPQWLR